MAAVAEEADIDYSAPPWLHLLSAFLAMEATDSLITLSRICGGGSITENVQSFVWNQCIRKADGKSYVPYLRNFLKKLILEIESTGGIVFDELYEQFAFCMTSAKGDDSANGNSKVLKQVSFLFPDGIDKPTHLSSEKLLISLQCSLNMLEGDTGCSIWPSALFLSELILSCPEIFHMKSCFEVGSGVGLVGICLAHVKASKAFGVLEKTSVYMSNTDMMVGVDEAPVPVSHKNDLISTALLLHPSFLVILSDGDLSSLANLRLNLELNKLSLGISLSQRNTQDLNTVQYLHLPWESAAEDDLLAFTPDIILGADVIYDPLCIPHLVRVLAALLRPRKSQSPTRTIFREGPVAYIASVIRNIDTFNHFLSTAEKANLSVRDITEKTKPFDLLPYMLSYQRSTVRLLAISYLCQ